LDILENTVSSFTIISLLESANALSIVELNNKLNVNSLPTDDIEDRTSEIDLINLWHYIDKNAKNPWYGLEIGKYLDHTNRGLLGSFLTQCETLIDALEHFIINIPWMNPSEKWVMEHNGEYTDLYYSLDADKDYPLSTIERSMRGIITWGETLSGTDFEITSASFKRKIPESTHHYEEYVSSFCENIQFSSPFNHIRIRRSILDRKIPNNNPYLKSILKEKLLKSVDSVLKPSSKVAIIYKKEVKELIVELLPKNKATIDIVCDRLFISRQTLYRHLKREETSFRHILNEVRKDKSIDFLNNNNFNITEISEYLGYKDVSSFYTAFNKWHNISVKEYKQTLNQASI
jgi:AraC-like DNA-binding protein